MPVNIFNSENSLHVSHTLGPYLVKFLKRWKNALGLASVGSNVSKRDLSN